MILSDFPRPDKPTLPPEGSASGLLKYVRRKLHMEELLGNVEDDRCPERSTVPTIAVLFAMLMGFLLNLGSVRATEVRLRSSVGFRSLVGTQAAFCDDTIRDVLSRVSHPELHAALYATAKREMARWGADRYKNCLLAQRLKPLNCSFVAAKAVVAIDGHETFCSEKVRCSDCHTRTKTLKRHGEFIEVEEYYHKVVVAQRIGAHPAVILDVELIRPGEGEQTAAYRLVERLGRVYGKDIGIIVADALHDSEPFRYACRKADFRSVVRHKDKKRQPGGDLSAAVNRRDSERQKPDGWHRDPQTGQRYEHWVQQELHDGRRYVEVRRTDQLGNVQVGALVTDIPSAIPALAAGIIMEMRWWQENTGFHELAGQLSFDRVFVHKNRPKGAWAIVLLTLLAYNVWHLYVYRHLGLDPRKPKRTWGDLRRDIFESLHQLIRRPSCVARPRAP